MKQDILRVLDAASAWLDIDGVEGVAPGHEEGKDCIVVGCSHPPSELAGRIPTVFQGYPVVLEDWGGISAQNSE